MRPSVKGADLIAAAAAGGNAAYRDSGLTWGTSASANQWTPNGTVAGDLLVYFVWSAGTTVVAGPNAQGAWALAAATSGANLLGTEQNLAVYLKTAVAADAGSGNHPTFTLGASADWYVASVAVSGWTKVSAAAVARSDSSGTRLDFGALPGMRAGDLEVFLGAGRVGNLEVTVAGATTRQKRTNDPNLSIALATGAGAISNFGSPLLGAHTLGSDSATSWIIGSVSIS
jgi:hypothetical protein